MAIFRTISPSFWEDTKVVDSFTSDDRYFFLYLLTNPHTNLCGCYEISTKQMSRETGYSEKMVASLLKRMQEVHDVILYDYSTKEVLIWNWHKYNWSKSEKLITGVTNCADNIKSETLKEFVFEIINSVRDGNKYDRVSIGYQYPMDTSNTNTNTNIYIYNIQNIVNHLNEKCNTHYRATSEKTKKLITTRLNEKYTEEDFFTVIDKKSAEWMGTEQERFLRPETLFGTKFESYLNQNIVDRKNSFSNFEQRDNDYDGIQNKLIMKSFENRD